MTPTLYAYGLTAPKGGTTVVPSDDGGHIWAADHSQGLCRMDTVTAAPSLHAYNAASCDDGSVLGSGGQTVYDPALVPGSTNLHYLYVAQNDHLSPGVIRFTFNPSGDSGAGALVDGSAVIMAPNAGLDGDKANALALGPCKVGAPASCQQALYVGGLLDGFIRRINNPLDDPRLQTVDTVAMTTEQRAGVAGRGINGSMGMIGDDLYLPENQGFTVIKNGAIPGAGQICGTTPLNISTFGLIFGSAIGVDPDLTHSKAGPATRLCRPVRPTARCTSTTPRRTRLASTRRVARCHRPELPQRPCGAPRPARGRRTRTIRRWARPPSGSRRA